MNIYEHFASHGKLPIKLEHVRDHILETGLVDKLVRFPVSLDRYIIQGGYQLYRDLTSYASGQVVARIAYPREASTSMQRLVCVKEALHVLDPHEATSPTKEKVDELIRDLRMEEASARMGVPAMFDRIGLLHALCILMPRDMLDELRPAYKKGLITPEQLAEEALIPKPYAQLCLTDTWLKLVDHIE